MIGDISEVPPTSSAIHHPSTVALYFQMNSGSSASHHRRTFAARRISCPYANCQRWFKSVPGLKHHQSAVHTYSFNTSTEPSHPLSHTSPPTKPAPGILNVAIKTSCQVIGPGYKRCGVLLPLINYEFTVE